MNDILKERPSIEEEVARHERLIVGGMIKHRWDRMRARDQRLAEGYLRTGRIQRLKALLEDYDQPFDRGD